MPGDSRSRAGLTARARALPRRLGAALRDSPGATREAWRLLGREQRAAAVGAILLAVSTLGPFSWVEAAELTLAAGVLLLLRERARRTPFHLPFGDGMTIAVAGVWAAGLILLRLPSRSPGQTLLALACAAVLTGAGLRERAKRPADDLPTWDFPTHPTERR